MTRRAVEWVLTLAFAAVVVLVFEAEIAKPYRVPSASMEPTLHCARPGDACHARFNDRVIANRLSYRFGDPKRGQIVVYHAPAGACGVGGTFVKRLIGLPGETISELNGRIFVNGTPLREPYVDPSLRGLEDGQWHVPKGEYFFLGDDRVNSCDSRRWGSVPRSSLIGRAVAVYWPPSRLRLL